MPRILVIAFMVVAFTTTLRSRGAAQTESGGPATTPMRPAAAAAATEAAKIRATQSVPITATAGARATATAAAVATKTAAAAAAKAAEEAGTSAACKKAVESLTSGNASGLASLDADRRDTVLRDPVAAKALGCLAIANDNGKYCDSLTKDGKQRCLKNRQLVGELGSLPKEHVKYQMLYRSCLANSKKADCDKVREAWVSGKVENCNGLPEKWHRDFCAALLSGDAGKCNGVTDATYRAYCAAVATEDASRCPKESVDCAGEVRGYARLKKEGVAGFLASLEDVDPAVVAARDGKKGCASFLSELERACVEAK